MSADFSSFPGSAVSGLAARVLHQPSGFLPRYLNALRLAVLMALWRQELPPLGI